MPDTVQYNRIPVTQHHTAPAIIATGEPVKFYDKDARQVSCADDKIWPSVNEDNVWVRGELDNDASTCTEMNSMLADGRVLAMAAEKGLVFQKKDDGHIIFYGIISATEQSPKVSTIEDLRQMLKTTFAGWHNAYHEVFAMAKSFSLFLANKLKADSKQLAH
jgi:hypothetical protein